MRSWERYKVLRRTETKFIKHHMTRRELMSKFRRDVNKTIFPLCPKSPKIIFDIGANMGLYTCWLAKHYKDTAHVYAFEPVELNFNYLVRNIELNKLSNVSIYNFGFYDKEITMDLGIPIHETSDKTGLYTHGEGKGKDLIKRRDLVECSFKKLSDFVLDNKIEKIDIMKMDVEGAQYKILSSSTNILNRIHYMHIELGEKIHNEEDKESLDLIYKNNFELIITRKNNWLFVNKNIK